jgi:3-hydroxyisobutyrate dehydrogenase-like beta-hydroxyacid dehydrogenase
MASSTIGLLHPGDMGGMVGASARANGLRVLWASEGRSAQTRERAAAAGLEDAKALAPLVATSQVIVSVCPPHAAVDLAREVAAQGFSGIYVDGNAVSPQTGREIGRIVEKGGATFVDGGIIGPPPRKRGTTRLYLSGEQAGTIARLLEQGPLEAIAIEGGPGAASALKMAYAAYTKGTSALLIAIRALAMQAGVDQALLDEWGRSQPGVAARSESAARDSARKAWRFTGEMAEIAATLETADLPGGFFHAAGEIYERLAKYKDAAETPPAEEVIKAALQRNRV